MMASFFFFFLLLRLICFSGCLNIFSKPLIFYLTWLSSFCIVVQFFKIFLPFFWLVTWVSVAILLSIHLLTLLILNHIFQYWEPPLCCHWISLIIAFFCPVHRKLLVSSNSSVSRGVSSGYSASSPSLWVIDVLLCSCYLIWLSAHLGSGSAVDEL